jgi:uncharacterized protein YjiS (DUF1127 family)
METFLKAPWRLQLVCAKIWQTLTRWPTLPKRGKIDVPSAHIARDIGLSPSEIERLTLRLPSETTNFPML